MNETKYWTWHIFAGVAILILLGLHMFTMHLDQLFALMSPAGKTAVDWENVVYRAKQAGVMIIYIVLLGAALYHGLFGLRNIIHEYIESQAFKKATDVLLWVAGIGLFGVGAICNVLAKISL
jgi:succinate dehydrogenase / fumarate reductase membrane anchor subunit